MTFEQYHSRKAFGRKLHAAKEFAQDTAALIAMLGIVACFTLALVGFGF